MFAWILRAILLFAVLTLIYVVLSLYGRWNKRKTLEAEFDAATVTDKPREQHVAEGMEEYENSLSKRLLLGVFVLPLAILVVLLLIANYM